MWGAEVAEPLRTAQGSLAKLGFGFLGPRQSQQLQPQQLKLRCHQSREFLTDPPCSQSSWDLHPSPQIDKKSKPAPFWVPALLSHIHTRAVGAASPLGPWVWQTQQMLCPVSDILGSAWAQTGRLNHSGFPAAPVPMGNVQRSFLSQARSYSRGGSD